MLVEREKPTHLSPSSINMYLEDPARWVLRYGYGVKGYQSAAMFKGIAVEAGVQAYFWPTKLNAPERDRREFAVAVAKHNFKLNTSGFRDSKDELAFDGIAPSVEQALNGLATVRGITMTEMPLCQGKVERTFDYDTRLLPVIGYTDFVWPANRGRNATVVVDLKSTSRIPSEPSANHKRQMALYTETLDGVGYLLYASDKKSSVLSAGQEACADLYRGATALSRLIQRHSWREMSEIFAPNFDSYLWCDESRAAAEELWK